MAGLAVGGWSCAASRRWPTLLDLRLFPSRTFNAALATNVLDFFVEFALPVLIALIKSASVRCP